ncbi:MAG: Mur ligase family protein, partial [Lachnospiraceae bacterium]
MKLSQLLTNLRESVEILKGNTDVEITGLTSDSRKVVAGSVFVCIKGAVSDGHMYLADVIEKGAAAVVIMDESQAYADSSVTVIKAKDTRYCYALMSAAWFDYPATKLFTIGITGTKGKTTTTYMIRNVLEKCGIKTGLIGTIETIIGSEAKASCNTTPESYQLHETFDKMVKAGCKAVVMEVSSQGLMLHRTAGINFDIGVFTNLEPDHIGPNEHSSFEQYLSCKAMLFKQCRVGIVNGDDEHVDKILENATCKVEKYGLNPGNDLIADNIRLYTDGGRIGTMYNVSGLVDMDIHLSMPGKFSVYNSLCAIAVTRHFNVAKEIVQAALLDVSVKGRIELVHVSDDFILMIDYAHNAMALESLLKTL